MKPIPQHQCMTPRTTGVASRVRTDSPGLIATPPTAIAARYPAGRTHAGHQKNPTTAATEVTATMTGGAR